MKMKLLPQSLAVCRLAPDAAIPAWAMQGELWSVTRSADELSIVCADPPAGARAERDWRAFVLAGPIPFGLTGILASVLTPLAEARIPIFAFSTFDTDYVMVQTPHLAAAQSSLVAAGHAIL